ncbi:acetate--CoA ligase [Salinisphaera sp. P385]|uniref:Acetyl-coenzyme A synthetase n=1 Tax=Spectribacter acetivorans TaxID=3075603 RepID=A0ABU3BA42_9GAMM|nr:acetate--CoA ligase [Salinisphaera sp. P385]MDT0618133.1 acetate--CoA ligase [Salinisphaera sp. P385]
MASNQIESVLKENRTFAPPQKFIDNSVLSQADFDALNARAEEDHAGFWGELARAEIDWQQDFGQALDDSDAPFFKWFVGGKLNVSHNCIDRHLADKADKLAFIWENDAGDEVRRITFQEFHDEVCRFANGLKALGVGKGDRVVIYMPMVPEAVYAMQACARIGAIHSVVFGGFSSEALRDRINDAEAKLLITADGNLRGGKEVPLKSMTDKALDAGCPSIEKSVVLLHAGLDVGMNPDRDISWADVVAGQSTECEPEWVDAEHPLFILYTSGSTGKPKGVQHSTGGYLLGAIMTNKWVFDLHADDIYWCTADVGWITGHTYICYGPTAVGVTQIMFEGVPTYPDAGRFWRMVQDHNVTIFYTAPTAIRALMKAGDDIPKDYDLSSLRLLGTVGEPINPEAWMWYRETIGKNNCPIVDTWWQTETGSIMISPLPGQTTLKPGSCTRPLPGIAATIYDEEGNEVTQPNVGGYLVVTKPWPSMLRTVWGDDQRFRDAYFFKFGNHVYIAGDSAQRDDDEYFWILGRIDDVVNVSGHRLGTMEVESALVAHKAVAEAAVVGFPHEVKGEAIMAFVVLKSGYADEEGLDQELRKHVTEQLGALARPEEVRIAEGLPKTRSGKIMRRLLKSIAKGEDITQDTSTLENPAILDQLRG